MSDWMKKISRGVMLLLILIPYVLSAQQESEIRFYENNDFRARTKVNLNVPIVDGLSFTLSDEARYRDNIGSYDRNYLGGAFSYKVCDYFSVSPGYVFMTFRREKDGTKYWKYGHRVYVDVKGMVRVGQWKLSLIECPYVDVFTIPDRYEEWILASKLKVEYNGGRYSLTPYVFTEISNTLNAPKGVGGQYVCRSRFCLGMNWKMGKRNSLDFYYYFDIDNAKSVEKDMMINHYRDYNHTLGIAYSFGI